MDNLGILVDLSIISIMLLNMRQHDDTSATAGSNSLGVRREPAPVPLAPRALRPPRRWARNGMLGDPQVDHDIIGGWFGTRVIFPYEWDY